MVNGKSTLNDVIIFMEGDSDESKTFTVQGQRKMVDIITVTVRLNLYVM